MLSQGQLRRLTTLLTNKNSSPLPAAPISDDVITQYFRVQKRLHSSIHRENEVKELEDVANDNPRDVQAQEAYLRVSNCLS